MRTKMLSATQTLTPWLQRSDSSGQVEQIPLEQFPFTVGRNESCDYQILSSKVSREHAEILFDGSQFRVRDLKSTNGTVLNGQKIDETVLHDGDLLVIADVEFSFHSKGDEATRKTVTQPMDSCETTSDGVDDAAILLVKAVRAQQEMLLHRAARNRFQPIVDLRDGITVGYEAIRRPQLAGLEPTTAERLLQSTDCRLTERAQQLHRLLAAEQAATMPGAQWLLLNLQPAEVGADALPLSLASLTSVSGGKRVVAEIPDSAVVDIPYFRHFVDRLRTLGLGVAYVGFAGGQHQIKSQKDFAPDFIKLSPSLARGVDRSSERQRQIKALVEAAGEIGAQLVAAGVHSDNEAQTCRSLGCRYAQGDHYGRPTTIEWPIPGVGLPT